MLSDDFTPARISQQDAVALSTFFGFEPPKDPDHFFRAAENAGLTPTDIWHRTATTTNIAVMIAAAAMRGQTKKLPPDPRLNPKPYPRPTSPFLGPSTAASPTQDPSRPTPTNRRPTPTQTNPRAHRAPPTPQPWSAPHATLAHVSANNPKKPGTASHTKFSHYAVGKTAEELRAAGMTTADFAWDTERQFITWSPGPAAA